MLNAYPYTPGHLMAVPYRHVPDLAAAEPDELCDLLELAQGAERLLRRAYGCRSVHTGANLGSAAGAGVPEHLHLHVVAWPEDPLWQRCAGSAESPETLAESWRRLSAARDELEAGRVAP
jgi:ATP adenylyltransferase